MTTTGKTRRIDGQAKSPAANALKHGLTAKRFVPADHSVRIDAIHSELTEIHRPRSSEERDCLAELARARARLFDAEAAHYERLQWEKAHATELYDRRARERYVEDLAAWRNDPFSMTFIFGATFLGATHLALLWSEIADGLAPDGDGMTYEQAKEAVTAETSAVPANRITHDGGWIMGRFLTLQSDPEAALERWLADGRDDASGPIEDDRRRARWFLAAAPDAPTARRELAEKADAERDFWILRANDLRADYETGRGRAAEMAVGLVPGDAKALRESRLALRYLTSARNQADKLERRLDALKKARPLNDLRSSRPNRTPAEFGIDRSSTFEPAQLTMSEPEQFSDTNKAEVIDEAQGGEPVETVHEDRAAKRRGRRDPSDIRRSYLRMIQRKNQVQPAAEPKTADRYRPDESLCVTT